MNRTNLAKRYAPLAAIAALQLLIIVGVPSKVPTTNVATGSSGDFGGSTDGTVAEDPTAAGADVPGAEAGPGGTASTVVGGAPGAAKAGGTKAGGTATGGGATTGTGGGAPGSPGDTSHCKDGRQFDPKIDPSAPPCVPKFAGDNGGATYRGVSKDQILIIDYYSKGDPAVDAVLKAQNAYATIEQRQDFDNAAAAWINKSYELYGRKVKIETYQGNCDTIPPDNTCLRNEVRQIISQKNPYAIQWNTSLSSAFFGEVSGQKVVNLGGWHFTKEFNQAFSPYHYDVQMDGTELMTNAATWSCAQVIPFNARYAQGNIKDKPRRIGLISTSDPDNKKAAEVYKKVIKEQCNAEVAAEYYYDQNISTAGPQIQALVNKMQSAGVTTEICLCDLVAPQVLYAVQGKTYNYFPETITTGSGFVDSDAAAQAYDKDQYKNAFGLSQLGQQEKVGAAIGSRVWRAGGRSGDAPFVSSSAHYEYQSLLASMIQAAGPKLTPANMKAGVAKYGRTGATLNTASRGVVGDSAWNDDMRVVYWDLNKNSSYNDKPGTYVNLFPGKRFEPGQYAKTEFLRP